MECFIGLENLTTSAKEVVFLGVFVCLSLCVYSKTDESIFMKFFK